MDEKYPCTCHVCVHVHDMYVVELVLQHLLYQEYMCQSVVRFGTVLEKSNIEKSEHLIV